MLFNWHQSTFKPHQSTSIHIFTFHLYPVWVSMGWESNRWKEIEAKLLRLPYECPVWFPIDVPVPWTKTWNVIIVAVQFMFPWQVASSPIVSGLGLLRVMPQPHFCSPGLLSRNVLSTSHRECSSNMHCWLF